MKEQFFKISAIKRQKIEQCAIQEFADHFYYEASLNNIIKQSRVSKGGLFKYIDSKEDLYLYLFEKHIIELIEYQVKNLSTDIIDFLDRLKDLAYLSVDYYKNNNNVYSFVLNALTDYSSTVYNKVITIRNSTVQKYQHQLLLGVSFSNYRYPKAQMLELYQWVSSAVNQSISNKNSIEDILIKLDLLVDVLKNGVVRR